MVETDKEKNKELVETAILKHSNQLSEMPLQGFTAKETDLFWGICYFVQNKGEEEVVIPFTELRELLGIERRGDKKLKEEMQETAFKFSKISLTEETENEFYTIVPFYGFRLNTKEKTFAVQVHRDFVKALNNLDGTPGNRYTLSDVRAISKMNSVFSKHALRMMFLYRNTGYWFVSVDNLRYFLDIPAGYRLGNITQRVIEPIRKDFEESGIFEEFEIIENKDESQSGKGRKRVVSYTFRFKFKKEYFENEITEREEDVISCPMCGKPLHRIEKKDGSGYFFGHKGGHRKDAECHYTVGPAVEIPASEVKVSEVEEDINVSEGDLDRYYAHIREEAQNDLQYRIEIIRGTDPELWDIYEESEKAVSDLVGSLTAMRLSGMEDAREDARSRLEEKRENLRTALLDRGMEEDYFAVRYKCSKCMDSGILPSGYFCECKRERAKEACEWIRKK